jgi:serine/threonine protein kinase
MVAHECIGVSRTHEVPCSGVQLNRFLEDAQAVDLVGSDVDGTFELDVGTRFGRDGRFEIIDELGRGGAGRVFVAFDHVLTRMVAVKFLIQRRSSTESLVEGLAEARIVAGLRHPLIVDIYDFDEWKGTPYLVMEKVPGKPLAAFLSEAAFPPDRALRIAIDVARGIAHAHQAGVLHLDLNPANVLLSDETDVKIIDFGISARRTSEHHGFAKQNEAFIGTPAYMAPEQWLMGPLDERTDIWALGMLLYELLVGKLPFASQVSLCARAVLVASDDSLVWRPLHLICPEAVPCLRRALAWDPPNRTPCTRELIDEMQEVLEAIRFAARRADRNYRKPFASSLNSGEGSQSGPRAHSA